MTAATITSDNAMTVKKDHKDVKNDKDHTHIWRFFFTEQNKMYLVDI